MRTISKTATNSCCFSVSGPSSYDNQGNKESCILSHVCDNVSLNLLILLITLDFRSFHFIILSRLFFFFLPFWLLIQLALLGFASSSKDITMYSIRFIFFSLSLFFSALTCAGPTLTDDAYTVTGSSSNYGAASTLILSPTNNIYLKFLKSSYFPTGTIGLDIAKATLKLYVDSVTTAGSFNVSFVTSTWTESTINGNNKPTSVAFPTTAAPVGVPTIAITSASVGQWINIDITNQVQDWLNINSLSYLNDFGLELIAANASSISMAFSSKENTTYSIPPQLDITMNAIAGATGPRGPAGPPGTISVPVCESGDITKGNGSVNACPANCTTVGNSPCTIASTTTYGGCSAYTDTNCPGSSCSIAYGRCCLCSK